MGTPRAGPVVQVEDLRMRYGAHDPASAPEDWRARVGVVLQSWRDHPRWTPRRLLAQLGDYYAPYPLGAWSVIGILVLPVGLRRMSPRQSGSQVEAAKDASLQWVR